MGITPGMTQHEDPLDTLTEIEHRADGTRRAERLLEAADLAESMAAEISLEARLRASPGRSLRVGLLGGLSLVGALTGSGRGWLRLSAADHDWVIRLSAVAVVHGLAATVAPEEQGAGALSIRSPLRAWLGRHCVLLLDDAARIEGPLTAVAADHLDLGGPVRGSVPLGAISAVRCGRDGLR